MKVSIVIPVFNEANTVATLLQQVDDQPLPGLEKELVIVESNSTDGSRQIVQDFCRKKNSPLVRLVLQAKPQGKGNAVRTGLNVCTGDIVTANRPPRSERIPCKTCGSVKSPAGNCRIIELISSGSVENAIRPSGVTTRPA